jgi:hypothetical protein
MVFLFFDYLKNRGVVNTKQSNLENIRVAYTLDLDERFVVMARGFVTFYSGKQCLHLLTRPPVAIAAFSTSNDVENGPCHLPCFLLSEP